MEHVKHATPEQIMNLGMAFWGSKTLLSAVEIGLFTELAKEPLDLDTLSERLMLHPRSARDFLDALVALGMLERNGERYSNTPETDLFLDRAKPSYVGGLLEMANARLYPFWGSLTEALRTGKPQNEAKTGGNFFTALYADPARLKDFVEAMASASLGAAMAIANKFPWDRYQTFVDVGTAQGALPVQVALAHEHLSGGEVSTCRPSARSSKNTSTRTASATGCASTRATSSRTHYHRRTYSLWGASCTIGTSRKKDATR